jgi:DNA polymerase III alpha subunit (gram-positive type)
MSYFSVDIEADGPAPGLYSMISFGAVLVEPGLNKTFYAELKPISDRWIPESLAVSGFTRDQTMEFVKPLTAMTRFEAWISQNTKGRPIFIADNPGFDFAFINYYFHAFLGHNPFGFSSRRIGDLYCGAKLDAFAKWKHMRETRHSHNALDDAKGNAEAILKMQEMGIKMGIR